MSDRNNDGKDSKDDLNRTDTLWAISEESDSSQASEADYQEQGIDEYNNKDDKHNYEKKITQIGIPTYGPAAPSEPVAQEPQRPKNKTLYGIPTYDEKARLSAEEAFRKAREAEAEALRRMEDYRAREEISRLQEPIQETPISPVETASYGDTPGKRFEEQGVPQQLQPEPIEAIEDKSHNQDLGVPKEPFFPEDTEELSMLDDAREDTDGLYIHSSQFRVKPEERRIEIQMSVPSDPNIDEDVIDRALAQVPEIPSEQTKVSPPPIDPALLAQQRATASEEPIVPDDEEFFVRPEDRLPTDEDIVVYQPLDSEIEESPDDLTPESGSDADVGPAFEEATRLQDFRDQQALRMKSQTFEGETPADELADVFDRKAAEQLSDRQVSGTAVPEEDLSEAWPVEAEGDIPETLPEIQIPEQVSSLPEQVSSQENDTSELAFKPTATMESVNIVPESVDQDSVSQHSEHKVYSEEATRETEMFPAVGSGQEASAKVDTGTRRPEDTMSKYLKNKGDGLDVQIPASERRYSVQRIKPQPSDFPESSEGTDVFRRVTEEAAKPDVFDAALQKASVSKVPAPAEQPVAVDERSQASVAYSVSDTDRSLVTEDDEDIYDDDDSLKSLLTKFEFEQKKGSLKPVIDKGSITQPGSPENLEMQKVISNLSNIYDRHKEVETPTPASDETGRTEEEKALRRIKIEKYAIGAGIVSIIGVLGTAGYLWFTKPGTHETSADKPSIAEVEHKAGSQMIQAVPKVSKNLDAGIIAHLDAALPSEDEVLPDAALPLDSSLDKESSLDALVREESHPSHPKKIKEPVVAQARVKPSITPISPIKTLPKASNPSVVKGNSDHTGSLDIPKKYESSFRQDFYERLVRETGKTEFTRQDLINIVVGWAKKDLEEKYSEKVERIYHYKSERARRKILKHIVEKKLYRTAYHLLLEETGMDFDWLIGYKGRNRHKSLDLRKLMPASESEVPKLSKRIRHLWYLAGERKKHQREVSSSEVMEDDLTGLYAKQEVNAHEDRTAGATIIKFRPDSVSVLHEDESRKQDDNDDKRRDEGLASVLNHALPARDPLEEMVPVSIDNSAIPRLASDDIDLDITIVSEDYNDSPRIRDLHGDATDEEYYAGLEVSKEVPVADITSVSQVSEEQQQYLHSQYMSIMRKNREKGVVDLDETLVEVQKSFEQKYNARTDISIVRKAILDRSQENFARSHEGDVKLSSEEKQFIVNGLYDSDLPDTGRRLNARLVALGAAFRLEYGKRVGVDQLRRVVMEDLVEKRKRRELNVKYAA